MDPQEYQIERLDNVRIQDLSVLYKAVYNKSRTNDYFSKKYETAYTQVQYIGYIAYWKKQPVSFYGVIPTFIQYRQKPILSAQSADTMTDPDHRNKGLFARLARMTFELCKANDIKFVFGFPNQHSFHGLKTTLQWRHADTLDSFTIPVRIGGTGKLFRALKGIPWIHKIFIKLLIRPYLADDKGLPNHLLDEGYDGVLRDEAFLKYKTYSKTHVLLIERTKVWISLRNNLWIGDLQGLSADGDLIRVISTLKQLASRMGAVSINFQASAGTAWHSYFSQLYDAKPSFAVMFLDLDSGIDFEQMKFVLADIDVF